MNKTKPFINRAGLVFGAVLAAALTGCIGYVDRPPGAAYVAPPAPYVESGVVVEPRYVYYPSYEVYYSGYTHQYLYRDGRSWVSHPAPPHVSAQVLLASPSVRLDFHDHPAMHHETVVRQYPRQWAPPGPSQGHPGPHAERP